MHLYVYFLIDPWLIKINLILDKKVSQNHVVYSITNEYKYFTQPFGDEHTYVTKHIKIRVIPEKNWIKKYNCYKFRPTSQYIKASVRINH